MNDLRCPRCMGEGTETSERYLDGGGWVVSSETSTCPLCEGNGTVENWLYKCQCVDDGWNETVPAGYEFGHSVLIPDDLIEAVNRGLTCPVCGGEPVKDFMPVAPEEIPLKDSWATKVMSLDEMKNPNKETRK
jgi:hypothetical protein